jgi:hypothetical protein
MSRTLAKLPLLLGLASACLGCSSRFEDAWSRARPKTFSCTGTVSHRGQPVVGALVNFASETVDPKRPQVVHVHQAVGFTDATGAFRLKTFRENDGAVAGSHRVRIAMPLRSDPADTPGSPAPPAGTLPARYAAFDTSGLDAEVVPDGPNHFTFTLAD